MISDQNCTGCQCRKRNFQQLHGSVFQILRQLLHTMWYYAAITARKVAASLLPYVFGKFRFIQMSRNCPISTFSRRFGSVPSGALQ